MLTRQGSKCYNDKMTNLHIMLVKNHNTQDYRPFLTEYLGTDSFTYKVDDRLPIDVPKPEAMALKRAYWDNPGSMFLITRY